MAQSWSQVFLHFVWATLRREPVLTEDLRRQVFQVIAAKCREVHCEPIAVGGTEDHVHVLLHVPPIMAPAELMKTLKGSTSHLITHQLQTGLNFRWQSGYGVLSVSKKHVPAVQAYILNQEARHREGKTSPFLETINDSILTSEDAPGEQST